MFALQFPILIAAAASPASVETLLLVRNGVNLVQLGLDVAFRRLVFSLGPRSRAWCGVAKWKRVARRYLERGETVPYERRLDVEAPEHRDELVDRARHQPLSRSDVRLPSD